MGEASYDHPQLAAKLLASVVGRVRQRQLKDQHLLTVLSTIAFHECLEVRRIVTELLETAGHPPLQTAVDHLEAAISVADFHVDSRPGGTGASGSGDACSWHVLNGRFGQEMMECSVFVHALTCESKKSSSSDYVDRSMEPESGDGQRYRRNMEVLTKLNPHDNLVKLMAFQLTPFLFYATEQVKVSIYPSRYRSIHQGHYSLHWKGRPEDCLNSVIPPCVVDGRSTNPLYYYYKLERGGCPVRGSLTWNSEGESFRNGVLKRGRDGGVCVWVRGGGAAASTVPYNRRETKRRTIQTLFFTLQSCISLTYINTTA